MNISIILVQHGNSETTIQCIESIFTSKDTSDYMIDVVVVDNKSDTRSLQIIKNYVESIDGRFLINRVDSLHNLVLEPISPNAKSVEPSKKTAVSLIENHSNMGFGAGCNIGMKYARDELNCNYVWLLNNDCRILDDTLKNLVSYYVGTSLETIVGATVLSNDYSNTVQCFGGGRLLPWAASETQFGNGRLWGGKKVDDSIDPNAINRKLDYVTGCSMFFSVATIEKVGFFDETFFLYWEDTDLCYRAKKLGISLRWCPDAIVYHEGSKSTGKNSVLTEYWATRNCIKFYQKHFNNFIMVTFPVLFTAKLINRLRRRQFDRINVIIKAIFHGIKAYKYW